MTKRAMMAEDEPAISLGLTVTQSPEFSIGFLLELPYQIPIQCSGTKQPRISSSRFLLYRLRLYAQGSFLLLLRVLAAQVVGERPHAFPLLLVNCKNDLVLCTARNVLFPPLLQQIISFTSVSGLGVNFDGCQPPFSAAPVAHVSTHSLHIRKDILSDSYFLLRLCLYTSQI